MWTGFIIVLVWMSAYGAYSTDVDEHQQYFGVGFNEILDWNPRQNPINVPHLREPSKRSENKAGNLKKQQHRRGSFDSLLAGNGFGRSAKRSAFPLKQLLPNSNAITDTTTVAKMMNRFFRLSNDRNTLDRQSNYYAPSGRSREGLALNDFCSLAFIGLIMVSVIDK